MHAPAYVWLQMRQRRAVTPPATSLEAAQQGQDGVATEVAAQPDEGGARPPPPQKALMASFNSFKGTG